MLLMPQICPVWSTHCLIGNIVNIKQLLIISIIFFPVSILFSILTCKWQYFYKSYVQPNGVLQQQNGNNCNSSPAINPSDNLHPEHFMAIMNAYGQIVVTGNDPNIVRTVLISMQNVHEKWRLYQRPLFKENLLPSFQSALINVLLSGEGALHFDRSTDKRSFCDVPSGCTENAREFCECRFTHKYEIN